MMYDMFDTEQPLMNKQHYDQANLFVSGTTQKDFVDRRS
jgi:hypothetical protein